MPKRAILKDELPTWAVDWTKTYYASGRFEVQAETEEEAERLADEMIGDQTGSMQYDPNENTIDVSRAGNCADASNHEQS